MLQSEYIKLARSLVALEHAKQFSLKKRQNVRLLCVEIPRNVLASVLDKDGLCVTSL